MELDTDKIDQAVLALLALGREQGVALSWWSPWNEPNNPVFLSPQRIRRRAVPSLLREFPPSRSWATSIGSSGTGAIQA